MLAECVILTKITVAASFIITMRRNEYVILMSAMHRCGITDFIGFEIRYFSAFVERKSAPPCWRVGRKLYLVKPRGWHGGKASLALAALERGHARLLHALYGAGLFLILFFRVCRGLKVIGSGCMPSKKIRARPGRRRDE